jgi:hypothetical protein
MFFGKPPSKTQSASSNGLDSTPQNTGISAVWSSYSAKKKKKIVTIGIIALIILIALLGYRTKYGSTKEKVDQAVAARDIDISRGMIEKSLYTRTIDAVDNQRKQLEKLSAEIAHLQKRSSQVRPSAPEKTLLVRTIAQSPDMKKVEADKPKPKPEAREPEPKPRVNNRVTRIPPPPKPSGIPEKERLSIIGGINIVKGKELVGKAPEETRKKK